MDYKKAKHDSPICIIGMHRSGTSMVARLLNLCGLNLGPEERLLGPTDDNRMGHFEHVGFLTINEGLLEHFAGAWDDPPAFEWGWENSSALGVFEEKVESLLETFDGIGRWGWKEPRTTLLLPFWQKLIPNLRYVICIRNPLEVCSSLHTRNGISVSAGARLWNHYMRAAIQGTEGQPRIMTFYDDYFTRPRDELNRITEFCGLRSPETETIGELISSELRHNIRGEKELLRDSNLQFETKLFYLGLRALRAGGFAGKLDPGMGQGRTPACGELLKTLDSLRNRERVAHLEALLADTEQELRRSRTIAAEREREIGILRQDNARLQRFSDAVRRTWVYRFYRNVVKPFCADA